MTNIRSFTGEYDFLRNDYESFNQVVFEGDFYNCVQRAFQAAKTSDLEIRKNIKNASSIRDVNSIGRSDIDLPDDWDERKVDIMTDLVRFKFEFTKDLQGRLFKTGDCELIMGDSSDTFWGIDHNGNGLNTMGKILTKVRDELKITTTTTFSMTSIDFD